MLPKVSDISPSLGCDPEFFFKLNGEVVGAEKFIPKEGIIYKAGTFTDGRATTTCNVPSKFIIDGVQAELNPRPNTCRANLANEIAACLKTLKADLKKRGNGMVADFSRTVEITRENLLQLDAASKRFGCAPSKSIYEAAAGVKITDVDPLEYRTRAAGGHIHIGKKEYTQLERALVKEQEKTVQMLDLICGNTCVLVDRDLGNIERRKIYGKAGEYRSPAHGLEYRTLSNFWLTSYPLMSFAFGMARLAVQLMADEKWETYYKAFMGRVKTQNIHDAINYNDFALACENFHAIEDLIMEVSQTSERHPINATTMKEFKHFVNTIQEKGMGHWFPQDPMTHWTTLPECHRGGFFDYLTGTVRADMNKKLAEAKVA